MARVTYRRGREEGASGPCETLRRMAKCKSGKAKVCKVEEEGGNIKERIKTRGRRKIRAGSGGELRTK